MKLILLGSPPLLEVADQLSDCVPVVGPVVSQPQAPQHRQKVVHLECRHAACKLSPCLHSGHLLHVLVAVEDEHVPGVGQQLALRLVLGPAGARLNRFLFANVLEELEELTTH